MAKAPGGAAVRDRIRTLFTTRLGEVISRDEIIAACRDPETGREPENRHQRLSELRTDDGYTILSNRDLKDIRPGQYMMPHVDRREIAGKRIRPTPATWKRVLERAGNACECNEAGQTCGMHSGAIDPIGGGTVKLTPDHMSPHSVDPNSDPEDPAQWQALCGRHQVTKKKRWDNSTGKLNVEVIVQAAGSADKRRVFSFLLRFFGYSEVDGRIEKDGA